MALAIYRLVSTGVYAEILEYGSGNDDLPIISTHDGELGETVIARYYVRNDDATLYYTNVRLVPVSKVSPSEVDGVSTGYGIKLYSSSIQPTEAEWEATSYANTITLSNIGSSGSGDTSSYVPFWARIEVPAGAPMSNRENTTIKLLFRSNAV